MSSRRLLVGVGRIESRIFMLRGHKVLLSTHLAELYGVPPKVLIQTVRRNLERFPADFMFQLSLAEFTNLKSQFVTSSWGGLRRARPYAFSEQGVAMLSSVLRSSRAIRVNIEIMRAFVRLRGMLAANHELAGKLAELEERIGTHDKAIQGIMKAIRDLMESPADPPKERIGFHSDLKDQSRAKAMR